MTGTEIFAVVGGVVAWSLAIGLGIRALQRARTTVAAANKSLDEAALVLEEPEKEGWEGW